MTGMTAWGQIVSNFVRLDEARPRKQPAEIPEGYKRCRDCDKVQLLACFYERRGHGSTSRCKVCYAAYQNELQKRKRAHRTPPNS